MKIGQVSQRTGLGIHTIRYYEKQGLINKPKKDASGHREYKPDDIELLNWIACMKHSAMPLQQIQEYVAAFYAHDNETRLALLNTHLAHLVKQRSAIDHYIEVTQHKIEKLAAPNKNVNKI